MPLFVTKWERRDGVDRDAFAMAALSMCRNARSTEGVCNLRFYWATVDTIAILVNAKPGSWAPVPDLDRRRKAPRRCSGCRIRCTRGVKEAWGEAGPGEDAFRMAQD